MPIFGYFLTEFIKSYIQPFANIIAYFIFTYLGVKFIKEAYCEKKKDIVDISVKTLILIGIATSIDAFSAGITLSLLGNKILFPIILIGFTTYAISLIGYWFGFKIRDFQSTYLEIISGVILIILGIKSLI